MDGSAIVTMMSTNGTPATAALNNCGAMFSTAPMRSPPALRPSIASISGVVHPPSTRLCAVSMKSVNVLRLVRSERGQKRFDGGEGVSAHHRESRAYTRLCECEGLSRPQELTLPLVLVPRPPHLAAAADMRDGINHPTVQQRQAVGAEAGLHARAVRAVRVQEQRLRRVRLLEVAPVHEGHGHQSAVGRLGLRALTCVQRTVVHRHLRLCVALWEGGGGEHLESKLLYSGRLALV